MCEATTTSYMDDHLAVSIFMGVTTELSFHRLPLWCGICTLMSPSHQDRLWLVTGFIEILMQFEKAV